MTFKKNHPFDVVVICLSLRVLRFFSFVLFVVASFSVEASFCIMNLASTA